jgi:tetratricopeptide (TPR) repeat protein
MYFMLGCLDQAEAHLAESLQLTRDYNIRNLNIDNHLLYGKIRREQADYSRAESYLFRALTAYSKQGNRWGLCTTILEIVAIHRLRGSYVEAETMVEEAERYSTSLDINLLKSRCLFERGRVLRDSGGSTAQVLETFQEALTMIRNLEVPELQSEILRETGDLLVRERRLEDAKQHYSKAEDRLRAILERLPDELQEFYREKHRGHFQLQDSAVFIDKSTAPASTGTDRSANVQRPAPILEQLPPRSGTSTATESGTSTVECMNDLMRILKNAATLEGFLQVVLKRALEVSRARSAFVLAVQGDQVHIRAALHSERSKTRDPQQLLALRLIEKVLQSRSALVIPDMARDRLLGELGGLLKQGARSLIIQPYQGLHEEGVLYFVDPVPTSKALKDDTSFYDFLGNLIPLALMHLEEPVPQV